MPATRRTGAQKAQQPADGDPKPTGAEEPQEDAQGAQGAQDGPGDEKPDEQPPAADDAAQEPQEEEPVVSAEDFLGSDDRERIPLAGLLAHKPELRDEQHTPAKWQELLAEFMSTVINEDPALEQAATDDDSQEEGE